MSGQNDFDRTLADWFEADAQSFGPAGGLERVLDVTRRRRPRPAWLAGRGSHWVGQRAAAGSSSGLRLLPPLGLRWSTAFIVLLVIAALVGGAILVGARLLQPAPLPTARLGHLAYGLDGDIFVADQDGRNPVRIADGATDNSPGTCNFGGEGAIWSPNGQYLAYRGCGNVVISDPAGHVVASFPGTGWMVSWSPDSTRVATWVFEGAQTIGVYGLDGVRQALVNLPTGYGLHRDLDPEWSPDGRSLLIGIGPPSSDLGADQVWELPIDGRLQRPVPSSDPRSLWNASYSFDGARVAYVAERQQPPPLLFPAESLIVAAADGSQERVVVSGPVAFGMPRSLVWSPTGDRIAYQEAPTPAQEVRVVDVASGVETSLARALGAGSVQVLRFSPEGDRILFARSDADNSETSLWSVRVDGSDAQLLVTGTGWGDWQPVPPA